MHPLNPSRLYFGISAMWFYLPMTKAHGYNFASSDVYELFSFFKASKDQAKAKQAW